MASLEVKAWRTMPPMAQDDRNAWGKVAQITGFGLTAGVAMLVCGWLGLHADRFLGTTPFLTILLFLGSGGCALWYGIVNILK